MLPCVDHDSERHEPLVLPRCRGAVSAALDDQPLSPDGSRLTAAAEPSATGDAGVLRPFTWRDLTGACAAPRVTIRLGATRLTPDEQRTLRAGSVVRLDPAVDEPVEIMAGRHVLGYGRMVLVDGKLAVQVTTRRQPSRRSAGQDPHAGT